MLRSGDWQRGDDRIGEFLGSACRRGRGLRACHRDRLCGALPFDAAGGGTLVK